MNFVTTCAKFICFCNQYNYSLLSFFSTLLETLDFPADFHADFHAESGDKFTGNTFPTDFAKELHSQVIPSWVIVS